MNSSLLGTETGFDRQPLAIGLITIILAAFIALVTPLWSIAILIGMAITLAILVRPWLGLVALGLSIPFAAAMPLPVGNLPVDGADLLLLLALGAWLLKGFAQGSLVIPWAPLTVPLVLFALALALSLPGAGSYKEGIPELVKWLQVLALYTCVVAILPARFAGWVLAALLLAGVGQALLGLYQFITQTGPDPFVLMGRFMRAHGSFRQPNPYAGYLGMVAPLAISLAIWSLTPSAGQRLHGWPGIVLRLVLFATALLISLGLLLSWSRGAWIAFAGSTMVVLLALSRRAAPLLVVILIALLGSGMIFGWANLIPDPLVERLADLETYLGLVEVQRIEVTDENFAVIERLAHWEAAKAMWADQPWLGVGIGNYGAAYARYALPRWQEALGHAHNVYLNFGAESGLLGFVAYLVFWVAAGWRAIRAASNRDRYVAAVGAGVLGAWAQITIHNLFDNLWVQHMYLHFALMLGVMAVLDSGPLIGNYPKINQRPIETVGNS
ncbi:MAG: O-antigen ligase family protein [Chloroflexota bacterium]|nr:O-antigen ligase family protein [Chloroflexota bacterium]